MRENTSQFPRHPSADSNTEKGYVPTAKISVTSVLSVVKPLLFADLKFARFLNHG